MYVSKINVFIDINYKVVNINNLKLVIIHKERPRIFFKKKIFFDESGSNR